MIVTQTAAPVYPQPKASPLPALAPETVNDAKVEPTVKGGARGIALLASDTAAIILTEQSAPQAETSATASAPAGLDLRGQDLREVDLSKLDLRGANLSDANLSGKDLTGLDLQGATMTRANLDGANLTDTNLNAVSASGASFRQASFARTNMNDADFSGAKFNGATFQRAEAGMTQEEMEKVGRGFVIRSSNLTGADFSSASFEKGVGFWDSKLDRATFDGANMGPPGSGILRSTLTQASFKGIIGGFDIGSSDASNADFTGISGGKVMIGRSKVDGLSFKGSNLRLRLSDLDLRSVDLNVANKDLSESEFENNIMTGKDFSGFKFDNSTFTYYGKNIENKFSSKSDLSLENATTGTNFKGATFKGVTFNNFDMGKALIDAGALAGVTWSRNESFDNGPRLIVESYRPKIAI